MTSLVQFISRIEVVLYALIGVGVFFSIRVVTRSRRQRRIAIYALEREAANNAARGAIRTIIALLLGAGVVYILAHIVDPNINPVEGEMVEPTLVVFVQQEPTPTPVLLLYPTITPTPPIAPADADEAIEEGAEEIDGCEIIGSRITNPVPGTTVSGQVLVEGEANILNFAQYKFEIRGPGTGDSWVVVGTFNSPVPGGFLGNWDATSLPSGNYTLRLVSLRTDGTYITPCEVPIIIVNSGAGVDTGGE